MASSMVGCMCHSALVTCVSGNCACSPTTLPMVSSALWHMQPTIDEAIKIALAGTLFARNYARFSSLRLKGCELAPLGTFEGKVPQAVMDRVGVRTAAIVAGNFTVPLNPSPPKGTLK